MIVKQKIEVIFVHNFQKSFVVTASWRGASDSVTDSPVISNPTDPQNVSCLGLCGRDICPEKLSA